MLSSSTYTFCLLLLQLFSKKIVYSIKGPTHIRCSIGEDASFMWNTTDQKEILSARWGIRKGSIPDPQFISVNGCNGKVHLNKDIDATLKKRVEFIGNLTIGRAWFVLKNLTVNDTNEYIASISDDVSRFLPYPVRVMVAEKDKGKPCTFLGVT
ncbi:uncharacterized protein LOC116289506 isoform X2 [Actinia tenebrosa]|uniref:Uncharacterized protein LOC116289506 isoform X2 n=1 Tax=Actinia tenebrosa TaxID=6105 RepID=A0A6P8HB19_ACTTE|nr:uncharacterized protein LOC116289506 isoform X2 [Actinia tenebrosa]